MYYAVIFTSTRTEVEAGYAEMAIKMVELAKAQPGYIGMESARSEIGITVSYWKSLDAIMKWRNNVEHTIARAKGKALWYQKYQLRICKVERDYGFEK